MDYNRVVNEAGKAGEEETIFRNRWEEVWF